MGRRRRATVRKIPPDSKFNSVVVSKFINYLTNKGFYVASQSRSNYLKTAYSLSSSLNMRYINYLSEKVKASEVIAFKDLGPEAVYRLEVKDFPLIVAIDCEGRNIYDKM